MMTKQEYQSQAAQGYNRIPLVQELLADLDTPLSLYLKLLDTALHWRKTTLAAGLGVLLLSALMVPLLPTGFVPQSDIGKSTVSITLPPSSTLSQTMSKVEKTTPA